MKKKTKFININVAFMAKSLSVTESALLSLIKSLSKKRGYCFASNKAICDTLNVSDRTLYRMLEKQGIDKEKTKLNIKMKIQS